MAGLCQGVVRCALTPQAGCWKVKSPEPSSLLMQGSTGSRVGTEKDGKAFKERASDFYFP